MTDRNAEIAAQMEVTEVTLEKIRLNFQHSIDPYLMGAKIDFITSHIRDRMIVHVSGYLLGEELEPKKIKHPKDWWQALKQRWFPAWATQKWPVIETVHVIDVKVLYPDFKPRLPDESNIIKTFTYSRDEPFYESAL